MTSQISPFCAYLSRLKYIQRWSLMRNSDSENVMEHSWMVAMVAHELALIHNEEAQSVDSQSVPTQSVDAQSVTCKALFHDVTEVLTGDLPTPIKYHSQALKKAYGEVEIIAAKRLIGTIPVSRQEHYKALLHGEEADLESSLVKASDKICAWIKCVEERRTGNTEFKQAEESIHEELSSHPLACVATWLKTYGESFEKSLDELGKMEKEIS